ncbi:MAG: adenylate kinase [Candidatus Firestonebacteria bacterium]|nr:adenylate kinase [Candidatus Firestonebacteria bacterium]
MNLILLGAPGSGKGTQGQKIGIKYSIPQISTGDILRESVKRKTALGIQAKQFMDKGLLVPDEVVVNIIRERIEKEDCNNGFILDGFPRTLSQAEVLSNILESQNRKIDRVVSLEVKDDVLIKRLSGRRICKLCGVGYHIDFKPSRKPNICDVCNGELYQRDDDKEETIKKRLKVYHEQTSCLKDYYNSKGNLRIINGNGDMDEIFNSLIKKINGK